MGLDWMGVETSNGNSTVFRGNLIFRVESTVSTAKVVVRFLTSRTRQNRVLPTDTVC